MFRVEGFPEAADAVVEEIAANIDAGVNAGHAALTTNHVAGFNLSNIPALPTAAHVGNDVLVTIPSGLGEGSIRGRVEADGGNALTLQGMQGRNHSNVADGNVAERVIPWIVGVERSKGDLR